MKLRQLHYIHEVAKRGLNVTAAAEALHTSQPGVSKQIRLLEEELGVDVFRRKGKHLKEMTPAGKRILEYTERLLQEIGNIRNIAQEYRETDRGDLSIATTHTQARYALPPVVTEFKKRFPDVKLKLLQGNPHQLAKMVLEGEVDVAIATEALETYAELVTLPSYTWHHCVVVPEGHALAAAKPLTLEAIAAYPIVTYDPTFAGRTALDRTFAARGLHPEVSLTALDSDVIKSYVSLGLGVGIISSRAFRPGKDEGLVALNCEHLFPLQTTRLAYKRGAYLRGFTVEFIRLFTPNMRAQDLKQLGAAAGDNFSI
jgi:LysR family cys regulon transcriptional activator